MPVCSAYQPVVPRVYSSLRAVMASCTTSEVTLAGWARGSPLAEKWDEAASDALEDLVAAAVRREQQSARRRRPFSARSGYTPF